MPTASLSNVPTPLPIALSPVSSSTPTPPPKKTKNSKTTPTQFYKNIRKTSFNVPDNEAVLDISFTKSSLSLNLFDRIDTSYGGNETELYKDNKVNINFRDLIEPICFDDQYSRIIFIEEPN
eukprot:Pgem_evm1s9607